MLLRHHTKLVMSSCDRVLALSFREHPGNERIAVVPPLVRRSFREVSYKGGEAYLVYLLNEGFVVNLIRLADKPPDLSFDLFSDLPLQTPVPEGIRLHRIDDTAFIDKFYIRNILDMNKIRTGNIVC